jgi:peptidoglycan/LPS O-acetylase OafA/YrhL
MTSAATSDRLHGLDAVRGFALLLGVVLHTAMSFLPGPQVWVVVDADRSTALSVAFFTIHMLRMPVFFFLAGYFGRMAFARRGATAFVTDRLQRIAVPLVLGWPLAYGAIVLVMYVAFGFRRPPLLAALTPSTFPLAHLWFLYILLLLYVAVLVLRAVVVWLDRGQWFRGVIDTVMRGVLGRWAPMLLAAPIAVALYQHPYWTMWFGIPTPDSSLYPSAAALISYGTLFGVGWLAHRQSGVLLPRWTRHWAWHLGVALVATATCLSMVGLDPLLMPTPMGSRKLGYAVAYAVGIWSWSLALIGAGLRFLSAHSAWRRYLADASYWIYLAHLPLVMLLQLLVASRAWPWQVKAPSILAVAMLALLLSYHFLVRSTFVGATLNGRRFPRHRTPHSYQGTELMRPLLLTLLLPALAAAQGVRPPAALPLDSVLSRHAAAVGPVGDFDTRRATLRVAGMAPIDLPMTIVAMRPNLIHKRVDIQGASQITAFDGRVAWRLDPFVSRGDRPMDVPAAELEDLLEEADFDGPLLSRAADRPKLRYVGPTVVKTATGDRGVHAVLVTFRPGRESTIYLDATSYLEIRRTQVRPVMGNDVEIVVTLSDYRDVQGIQVPHLTEIALPAMPQPIRIVMEKVEMDAAVAPSIFTRPQR